MDELIVVETANDFSDESCKHNKDALCWYALYTKPRAEKKVKERLEKKGWVVYLPLLISIRQWSDRKKRMQLPLIPGIVFVYVQRNELRDVLMSEGVISVIRYLGQPAQVREYEIDNLRILLRDPDLVCYIENEKSFDKGVLVQVIRGPFMGVVGTCIRKQGRHSLVVEIGALNSRLMLTLPVSFVKTNSKSSIQPSELVV